MRNPAPVVSVIVPFLDRQDYIEEAVASVFMQSYPHWELLLVDDGSSDRSVEIARGYAERHPDRVRYMQHPGHCNLGTCASRNLGMAEARGEYIAFLDSDDVYFPERLQRHVEVLLARSDVGVVQSDTLRWYSWAGPERPDVRVPWPFPNDGVIRAPAMLWHSLDRTPRDGWFPSTCSVTFRRSVLSTTGGFEANFSVCEDWVFFTKLYLHNNAYLLNEVLALYRKHPKSVMHQIQSDERQLLSRKFLYHLAYLLWFQTWLKEKGAPLDMVMAVHRQLWPEQGSWWCDVLGLPPAIVLALRVTNPSELLKRALPGFASRLLRDWRHAIRD